jgi:TPR repeat protein
MYPETVSAGSVRVFERFYNLSAVGEAARLPSWIRHRHGSSTSLSAPLSPTATAAAPASTAPISAPPSPTAVAASDRNEAAALSACTRAGLPLRCDVALARVFLRRAAERDDPQAALALGGTYDPMELKRIGIPNFQSQADPAKAQERYHRAADLGSAAAASRLDQLSRTGR